MPTNEKGTGALALPILSQRGGGAVQSVTQGPARSGPVNLAPYQLRTLRRDPFTQSTLKLAAPFSDPSRAALFRQIVHLAANQMSHHVLRCSRRFSVVSSTAASPPLPARQKGYRQRLRRVGDSVAGYRPGR